jgi:NitT/TauT family transport system permease protein
MNYLSTRLRTPLLVTVTLLVLLAIWEAAVRLMQVPLYLLPPPSVVVQEAASAAPELLGHTWVTLLEILVGLVISAVIGIPLGVLIVYSPWMEQVSYVMLVISQAVPKVALAPLFLVWLGFGMQTIVLMTFLIAFFPIVVSTVVGLRSIEAEMLSLARALKADQLQIFLLFRLPVALPSIFGGLKVACTLSVVGAIVAEFVGSQKGLGYLILAANANFQTPLAFASIGILSIIGLALFYFIAYLEHRIVFWRRAQELETGAWQERGFGA